MSAVFRKDINISGLVVAHRYYGSDNLSREGGFSHFSDLAVRLRNNDDGS